MTEDDTNDEIILTLSCPDRVGIVHSVAGFLAERTINIVDSKQFADPSTGRFFMRVQAVPPPSAQLEVLRQEFGSLAEHFDMTFELHDARERPRVLILVSRLGHCLNDLLYRHSIGALKAELVAVVSNHRDFEGLARSSASTSTTYQSRRRPRTLKKQSCAPWSTSCRSTWWSWPGTCRSSPSRPSSSSRAGRSTSTTPSYPASRERPRTGRHTSGA